MSRRYLGSFVTYNPVQPTTSAASGMWPLDQQLQQVAAGTWPLSFGDPYFNYTSLLLSTTALSNANNNLFVDSSGAFNPISRNGNTTQGSFAPYGSYWSNYLDNSGDYLTAGSGSSAFAFGTGDFTIEGWFYSTASTATWKPMMSVGAAAQGQLIRINQSIFTSGNWGMLYPNDAGNSDVYFDTGSPFPLNQWVHVALVRSGTTLTLYQNGVNVLQKTVGFNFTNTTGVAIGYGQYAGDGVFGGYVSNIRIVKGTAVYTANFTPPKNPLTAITNTSLLTCQSNRFRDASSNAFAITVNGDTRVTNFAPFLHTAPIQYNQSDITNWSGYFDGTGDYLTVPDSNTFDMGTGDFTVETWVYHTTSSGNNVYAEHSSGGFALYRAGTKLAFAQADVVNLATSTNDIPLNQWVHVAATRSGTTLRLWINGVQEASVTNSTNFTSTSVLNIGTSTGNLYMNGYLSNLRIVKGTAVYTSAFTPSTTNLTAISGTSLLTLQNAAFTDNSTNNFVITINGNTTVTGNSPFNTVGYWSNYFDGSGDDLYLNGQSAFAFGTGDFTIEGWIFYQPTGALEIFIDLRPYLTTGAYPCLYLDASGNIIYDVSAATRISGGAVTANTWNHFALARSGTSTKLFVNGTQVGSTYTDSNNYGIGALRPVIGTSGYNPPDFYYKGYLSNIRMVKGTAVYTSNFTPPAAPLTAISGTSLLTCQSSRFIDNSSNNFTINVDGNTSVQSFDPFYTSTIASNGGSMYFDGNTDWLQATSPNLSGTWTVELWWFPASVTAQQTLISFNNGSFPGINIWCNSSSQLVVDDGANAQSAFTGGTFRASAWNHVAIVRSGATTTGYINGVAVGSNSFTPQTTSVVMIARYNQGASPFYTTGYISDVRVVNGTAVYTAAFTPPTAPLTPSAATNLLVNGMNAGAYDATAINNMETVGNAQVSTTQSKFGGSSMYFDGTGDYLTSNAANDLYAFGTGDFTIEMWFNLSSFSSLQILYDSRPTSTDGLYPLIYVASGGGSVIWQISAAARITGTATLSTGVWYHLAVSRSSGSTKMFLNGTQVGSTYADTNAYLNSGTTRPFIGGSSYSAGTLTVNGYIDDLRITKGVARYTTTFTPPTAALPTY